MSPADGGLPPVHDVMLDDATVAQLFFDVRHAAELLGVTIKQRDARRADPADARDLETALAELLAGSIAGVQLRYRHGGEEWWDTLSRSPAGIRLVRISHTRARAFVPDGG